MSKSKNLSQDQIRELITNDKSADEKSVWFSYDSTSDSELEDDNFVKIIKENLISNLCSSSINIIRSA